jgi:hypothetical protein
LELLLITIKYLRPIVVPSGKWNELLKDQVECWVTNFAYGTVSLFFSSIIIFTVTHSPLLNYLHRGDIAEQMVAESLSNLIYSCAFLSPPNTRVGHLGCTALLPPCTYDQHDRSHPRWCEGACTPSINLEAGILQRGHG